ncbi:type IVB secretion system protein IcmH/DotU [Collimonas fungivorans]|uniref:Putative transmembrane protein n=1 Tax=Collimonas fungivorans (strain Ter331) TaxID=1005048 RepID=G0A806_COLFT|nr:type IVB secretion system protein IcmH/DotU [Collimonas fungivorans]AEK59917.1 putative transmembrane protein [Collimonas fungivorans Ter331]
MNRPSAPSLLGDSAGGQYVAADTSSANSLLDLMYDGFYALFLLKNRCAPTDEAGFTSKMQRFLSDFERGAKKLDVSAEDVHAAKYAFCAAVDENILHSQFNIRDTWARRPLQLILFGDQLAGEHFFTRLEDLRAKGAQHLQALEVFHMCLLLGFQGKYIIEGPEKLNYLTARLGDEIARMKGKSAGFAPHWERPDQISHKLRNEVPLWALCSVFALIGLGGYFALNTMLSRATASSISGYSDIVKLAPRASYLTITLP